MWVAFANTKATHIFSTKNISIRLSYTLINDIVSFEQLGPGVFSFDLCLPLNCIVTLIAVCMPAKIQAFF